jgi:hypothetical protein
MLVFGGSLGVASSFIVLNNTIQDRLTNVLSPTQLRDFCTSPTAIYSFVSLQQLEVREVYIDTFNANMRVCIGISPVSIVAVLCSFQRNPPTLKSRLADLAEVGCMPGPQLVRNCGGCSQIEIEAHSLLLAAD